jgi:hypothetical protein
MATLEELRNQIYRLLGSPDGTGYTNELVIDSINMAFDAILPWVPKTETVTIVGSENSVTFTLPEHTYEVEAVINNDGEVLPRSFLLPGQHIGIRSENINDWMEYPEGSITFSKALNTGQIYTVYYLAHWNKPTTSTEKTTIMEPPERATIGIALYGAAYCLLPSAVGASEIRQFGTRIDSGTPEHNPMQKTMLYLLDLFQREMSRHPKHQKAVK